MEMWDRTTCKICRQGATRRLSLLPIGLLHGPAVVLLDYVALRRARSSKCCARAANNQADISVALLSTSFADIHLVLVESPTAKAQRNLQPPVGPRDCQI